MEVCMSEEENFDATRFIIDSYEHPQPGIFYTVTRVPGKNASEALFEVFGSGCVCKDSKCSDSTLCSCLKNGQNYKRRKNNLILEESKFGDLPVLECNFSCSCFQHVIQSFSQEREKFWHPRRIPSLCQNRCVQFGPSENLQVFDTVDKGFGLKTTRKMESGSFICEYAGEVISLEEAKIREAKNLSSGTDNFIFVLTEHFQGCDKQVTCIDPTIVGNIGRYINHSCQPNSAIVPVRVNNVVPLLCVFAKRDIAEDEEITFDYSGYGRKQEDAGVTENRKPCLCGSVSCQTWLPHQML